MATEPSSSWTPVMAKILPTVSRQLTWLAVARKLPVCHAPAVVWKVGPAASAKRTCKPRPFVQFHVPAVIRPALTVMVLVSQVFTALTVYSETKVRSVFELPKLTQ